MNDFAQLDSKLWSLWSELFQARTAFKWVLSASVACLSAVVLVGGTARLAQPPGPTAPRATRPWTLSGRLVYLAFIASVVALSLTSFYSVLRFQAMHGWWLVAHMVSAGVFVPVVTVMALFFSRGLAPPDASLDNRNAPRSDLTVEPGADAPPPIETGCPISAVLYWLIFALSLVVTGTILLGMFPLFGTLGLERLIEIHRYSGLGLFAAVVLHGLLVATGAARQRSQRRA
jgi:hypothetical protein